MYRGILNVTMNSLFDKEDIVSLDDLRYRITVDEQLLKSANQTSSMVVCAYIKRYEFKSIHCKNGKLVDLLELQLEDGSKKSSNIETKLQHSTDQPTWRYKYQIWGWNGYGTNYLRFHTIPGSLVVCVGCGIPTTDSPIIHLAYIACTAFSS